MAKSRQERILEAKRFVHCADFSDPKSVTEHELVRHTRDAFVARGAEMDEHYMKDFCWPVEAKAELVRVCEERAKLKKAYDDSMSMVYDLGNRVARGEV